MVMTFIDSTPNTGHNKTKIYKLDFNKMKNF